MKVNFKEILGQVKLEDSIANAIIEIEGEKQRVVGFMPSYNAEAMTVMKEKGVTMGDLFFLEPPRTFEGLVYRNEHYKVDISLVLEPIETIKIRR